MPCVTRNSVTNSKLPCARKDQDWRHLLFISERSRLSVIVALREAKRLGTVYPGSHSFTGAVLPDASNM